MNHLSTDAPRLAVVGTGWWSTEFHLPSLSEYEGAELVALVDSDPERLSRVAERYPQLRTFTSLEEFLDANVADGVVIATPSATHFQVAAECLRSGLHVMLEKPMTIEPDHAWELVRLAQEGDLHVTVGFTFQHTRAAEVLWQEMRDGSIGEIVAASGLFASMVEAYYRGTPEQYHHVFQWSINGPTSGTYSRPELAGGGQAFTQLSPAFGVVMHACGRPVREIFAKMEYQDLPVDLADAMTYEFWNGGIGSMCSTGNMRPFEPHQQEFRYYGTRGYALQDLVTGSLFVQRGDGGSVEISGTEAGDPYPASATSRHLADLIAGRASRNRAPAHEGAWVTDALNAAYRSAASGRAEAATDRAHAEGEKL